MENRIKKIIFNHPYIIFGLLLILETITVVLKNIYTQNNILRLSLIILRVLLGISFFVSIIHIISKSLKNLLKPKSFLHLIQSYILLIIGIIIIFSSIFNFLELSGTGYLTYGKCTPSFDPKINNQDISHDFLYFSATTFFTVGYGDVCPVGASKFFATINAFTGNIISVILMGLIINNYLANRTKGRKKDE